ncbi:MAG: hypothetical protein JRJ14_01890 [Deltaproteobacteria bacterium]|nr:hypothetical protein [Deltaproteobacteria bacterium]
MCKCKISSQTILLIFSLVLISSLAMSAIAQDSLLINYQGRLTNNVGDPLDTTVMIMFNIYDGEEHYFWGEGQSTTVTNGLFNVILGSVIPLPDTVFSGGDRYLGITVGADPEISPRTLLTSAPSAAHAHHASTADTAGYVEGGVGVTQFINIDGVELVNGYLHFLAWDSINVPDVGYVMCQATATLACDHVTGIDACMNIEFRDDPYEHLLDQEHYWCLPPSLPTDLYQNPVNIHRIFPVVPGWNLFNLIGWDFRDAGSTFYAYRVVMTMTYIPESYGTVQFEGATSVKQDQPRMMLLDDQLREELIQRSQH